MRRRLRSRPLGLAALALVALETAVVALGGRAPVLSAAVLVVAPGLALTPVLPDRTRRSVAATLAAVPALALAASSIVLISLASVGVPLTGTAVRLAVAGTIAVAVLALPGPEVRWRPVGGTWWRDADVLGGVGLLAAVAIGALLQERVLGGAPVPGNDWAKYVLYADEIRREGALLIDNPYWMLGVPFREDPGVPAIYGSYLSLTGQSASVLVHGIWAFAVIGILSTFAFVRSFWGPVAGALAAALWAVLPVSHDILAWHGLPNAAALALLPLVLLYLTTLVDDELPARAALGFALVLVSVAALHRFSLLVAGVALAAALVAAVLVAGDRRRLARGLLLTAVACVVVSPGVAYDLVTRARTFGGTQDHTAYLTSKVDLGLVAADLTVVFSVASLVAVGLAVWWARREHRLLPTLATLAVVALLAYGWIVELPLVYFRMAYFLPVALAPLVAIALTRVLGGLRAAVAGIALVAVVAAFAWPQASNVRRFYAFANPASLRGLDSLATQLRSDEVVVTDRCWSFLATWLLHARTLPALEPEDIQPKAELARAREARLILDGGKDGRRLAKRLGVRFLLVSPTCPDVLERQTRPPKLGVPVFVSERLVILRLPGT